MKINENCFLKRDVAVKKNFLRDSRCCAEMFWLYDEFGEKNCCFVTSMKLYVVVKKNCFTRFLMLCRNVLIVQQVWWKKLLVRNEMFCKKELFYKIHDVVQKCFGCTRLVKKIVGMKRYFVVKRNCFTIFSMLCKMFWLYNKFGVQKLLVWNEMLL